MKPFKSINQAISNPWTELICVLVFCWSNVFCTTVHWCMCGHLAHNHPVWYYISDAAGILILPILFMIYMCRDRILARIVMIFLMAINMAAPITLFGIFHTHLSRYLSDSLLGKILTIFLLAWPISSISQILIAIKQIKAQKQPMKIKVQS